MQTEISGIVDKIIFRKEETGFIVASLKTKSLESVTIVGQFVALAEGEQVLCRGVWAKHKQFGKQFKVKSHETKLPEDAASIELYLASDYVKGIGPVYAKRIVDRFGDKTLKILDHQSEKLKEVPGLGKKRLEQIRESWQIHSQLRQLYYVMNSVGLTPSYAQRIYHTYKHHAVDVIKHKPYQLAKDIHGIGFLKADEIAKANGILATDEHRIEAGLDYILIKASQAGHTCLQKEQHIFQAQQLLGVDLSLIEKQLKKLLGTKTVLEAYLPAAGDVIYTPQTDQFEQQLCADIQRIQSVQKVKKVNVITDFVVNLTDQQQDSIQDIIRNKLSILTGGPGTGKSTVTAALVRILQAQSFTMALIAPTGKAAKRLQELTGSHASTIHHLLQFDPRTKKFRYHQDNRLKVQWVIIDEVSMLDLSLACSLFQAIPSSAQVLLVGDPDQLPSVGPGHVLRDLLLQKTIAHVALTQVFRQAAGSAIIQTAHAIREGQMPEINNDTGSDLFFIEKEDGEDACAEIVGLVTQRLPKAFGFDSKKDIQVLSPQHRGPLGTQALNTALQQYFQSQQIIDPEKPQFFEGDKVIQLHNNYDLEVFNGDVGLVQHCDMKSNEMTVKYDTQEVQYDTQSAYDLALAYCITIHKFQGSEAPCIILPIHASHFQMLSRNLFYTGVTRGKKCVVMVGQKKALWMAIQKATAVERQTRLWQVLKELL